MSIVTDNILKTIDYAIDKKMEKIKQTDESGVITGIGANGIYEVLLQGEKYLISNGCGIAFKVGDLVWVRYPNGNFNKKFIYSSRTPNSKTYDNAGTGEYGGGGTSTGTEITLADFATIADIDALFE